MRIANYNVAVPKEKLLDTELTRGKQISELPQAAYDDRSSCPAGSRNERQVGVEIKSMGNLDRLLTQATGKPQPSPPGVESVQRTAEFELMNIPHQIAERTKGLEAAYLQ